MMKSRSIFLAISLLLFLVACNQESQPLAPPSTVPNTPIPTTENINQDAEPDSIPTDQAEAYDQGCQPGSAAVVLIVDPEILDGIRPGLTQFEEDLQQQGYIVIEESNEFATPMDLRSYLADIYNTPEICLTGAFLIGDLPYAYQWFRVEYPNPDIPPSEQEVISYQYYADLDGTFRTSEEYISPGGRQFSFDIHEGEVDWEIWVGLLPSYRGNPSQTISAINRYFEKNHAYRQGEYTIPRAYLEINEFLKATTEEDHTKYIKMLQSGQYAWTPFSEESNAQFFFNSPSADMTVEQGYAALTEGVADFTGIHAHGSWQSSGRTNINWVESNPIQTVFFYTGGCSTGDLDHPTNYLTSILYSPTSQVLLAWGTTSESGGMGSNQDGFYGHNIASDLSEGKSFGKAILEHVNTPLISPWSEDPELHFSVQIFLGDPALTLFPKKP